MKKIILRNTVTLRAEPIDCNLVSCIVLNMINHIVTNVCHLNNNKILVNYKQKERLNNVQERKQSSPAILSEITNTAIHIVYSKPAISPTYVEQTQDHSQRYSHLIYLVLLCLLIYVCI